MAFTVLGMAVLPAVTARAETPISTDIVVYKANPGGIVAAVAAAKAGAKVVLVEPTAYVGGITAQGGLGASDVAHYETIGGLSREFFRRVGEYYKTTYGPDSQQLKDSRIRTLDGGRVEPKVAEQVYEELLKEQPNIQVIRKAALGSVQKEGTTLVSITCQKADGKSPLIIKGREFIDASYTGDLMAMAKVSYSLGSESRDQFGELYGMDKPGPQVQAFNYRIPVTKDPANRIPFEKPAHYDPNRYTEFVARYSKEAFPSPVNWSQYHLPNQKLDSNLADMPGFNWGYAEADPAARARLEADQRNFSLGYLYFLQNDPRLPQEVLEAHRLWGLCKDEFEDNGHFPREIYVRESRRLNAEYITRQQDLQDNRFKKDSIAVGSIALDCHAVQSPDPEFNKRNPLLRRGGGIMEPLRPYDIAYRSIVPKEAECGNLLVPVCLGATHVAWTSIRMEPVFMMTGEAAGLAAKLALDKRVAVQKVPVGELQAAMTKGGCIIHSYVEPTADFDWEPKNPKPGQPVHFFAKPILGTNPAKSYYWDFDGAGKIDSREKDPTKAFSADKGTLVTLVVEDSQGKKSKPVFKVIPVGRPEGDLQLNSNDEGVSGDTSRSARSLPHYGTGFGLDMGYDKGRVSKTYAPKLAVPGIYSLYISSSPGDSRSKNTLIKIDHDGKKDSVRIDQSQPDPLFGWVYVGDFSFRPGRPASVTIDNTGTEGVVIFDAVRWVLKQEGQ